MNGKLINLSVYRADVVLKTILRQMRKTYLDEFNESTNFAKSYRFKDKTFYEESLTKFVTTRFLNYKVKVEVNKKGFSNKAPLPGDLEFYLGSIFYPKHMKSTFCD
jgi:hypothetical protein